MLFVDQQDVLCVLTKSRTTEKLNRYIGNFFFQNGTRGSLTLVSKLNTCFFAVRNLAK